MSRISQNPWSIHDCAGVAQAQSTSQARPREISTLSGIQSVCVSDRPANTRASAGSLT